MTTIKMPKAKKIEIKEEYILAENPLEAEFRAIRAEEKLDDLIRTVRIKNEYLKLIDFLLVDYDGCKSVETLKELIDETREYIHKALNNDDKSVITVNSKKKFNILGEEVE